MQLLPQLIVEQLTESVNEGLLIRQEEETYDNYFSISSAAHCVGLHSSCNKSIQIELTKLCFLCTKEARIAIEQRVIPEVVPVDLLPRPSNILLLQKDLIRKYNLQSERVESELGVRLRILPVQDTVDEDDPEGEDPDDDGKLGNLYGLNDEMNGSVFSVDRLPLLPDQNSGSPLLQDKRLQKHGYVCTMESTSWCTFRKLQFVLPLVSPSTLISPIPLLESDSKSFNYLYDLLHLIPVDLHYWLTSD